MRTSWKLRAGYKLETGQLAYKLDKLGTGQLEPTPHELEIPGPTDELESWKLNCELKFSGQLESRTSWKLFRS